MPVEPEVSTAAIPATQAGGSVAPAACAPPPPPPAPDSRDAVEWEQPENSILVRVRLDQDDATPGWQVSLNDVSDEHTAPAEFDVWRGFITGEWHTDAEQVAPGLFLFRDVPPGRWRARAGADRHLYHSGPVLRLDEQSTRATAELHPRPVPADQRIEGIIRSEDGSPFGVRTMRFVWMEGDRKRSRYALHEEDGSFHVALPEPGLTGRLELRTKSSRFWTYERDSRAGERDVEVLLEPIRRLTVKINFTDGEPVPQVVVSTLVEREGRWTSAPTSATRHQLFPSSGAFMRVLREPFRLRVVSPWSEKLITQTLAPEDVESVLTLEVTRHAQVQGAVTRSGVSVGDLELSLVWKPPPTVSKKSGKTIHHMSRELTTCTTSSDGSFCLPIPLSGSYEIRTRDGGRNQSSTGPITLHAGVGRTGVVLELGPTGGVSGRILLPPDASRDGLHVKLHGPGRLVHDARMESDVAFVADGLQPGQWAASVWRRSVEVASPGERRGFVRTPFQVVAGETARIEPDLASVPEHTLVGRVRLRVPTDDGHEFPHFPFRRGSGRAPRGASLYSDQRLHSFARARLHGAEFHLAAPEPGTYQVRFYDDLGFHQQAELVADVELRGPVTEWDFSYDLVKLHLTGNLPSTAGAEIEFEWERSDGSRMTGSFDPLAKAYVPPGRVAIYSAPEGEPRSLLGTITVPEVERYTHALP